MLPASSTKTHAKASGSGHAPTASRPGKYGLKAIPISEESKKTLYQEGLDKLKRLQSKYKADVKQARENALAEFDKKREDSATQDWYATQLDSNRITKEGFLLELGKEPDFKVDESIILYKGIGIANLLEGQNAYEEDTSVIFKNKVFRRVDLTESGTGGKDYVFLNGAYIRRWAYRAIAPPERVSLMQGRNLMPAIIADGGDLTEETKGIHFFDDGNGKFRDKGSRSDVEFISDLSGNHKFTKFPAEEKTLLAYTQIRNGVGKVLSGRSTSKDITSNHGASFSRFGEVKIDLAKVPESNILHHYNVAAFDSAGIKSAISRITGKKVGKSITNDVERGNLSVIRNRELLFTEIPYEAVEDFVESPSRIAYEKEYYDCFPGFFISKFNQLKKAYAEENPALENKLYTNTKKYTIDFNRQGWAGELPGLRLDAFTAARGKKDAREDATKLATEKFNKLVAYIETLPAPKNYPAPRGGSGSFQRKNYK